MADTFYIKQNDLQPYFYFQAVNRATGAPIDITGATIYCTMKAVVAGTLKINRQTAGIVIDNGPLGLGHWVWQSGNTDTVTGYYIEFEINPLVGGKFTIPIQDSDACVVVRAGLDTA